MGFPLCHQYSKSTRKPEMNCRKTMELCSIPRAILKDSNLFQAPQFLLLIQRFLILTLKVLDVLLQNELSDLTSVHPQPEIVNLLYARLKLNTSCLNLFAIPG